MWLPKSGHSYAMMQKGTMVCNKPSPRPPLRHKRTKHRYTHPSLVRQSHHYHSISAQSTQVAQTNVQNFQNIVPVTMPYNPSLLLEILPQSPCRASSINPQCPARHVNLDIRLHSPRTNLKSEIEKFCTLPFVICPIISQKQEGFPELFKCFESFHRRGVDELITKGKYMLNIGELRIVCLCVDFKASLRERDAVER